jgi:acylphosphatase
MKLHWNFLVKGKVQGVFYRKSAKVKAEELGLSGWVRNEADGSVYIEAEGDEHQLKQFKEWCKLGPSHASVDEVTTKTGTLKNYSGFEIRRF